MNQDYKLQNTPQIYRRCALRLKAFLIAIASAIITGVILLACILFIVLISQAIMTLFNYIFHIDLTSKHQNFHLIKFLLTLLSFVLGTGIFFALLIPLSDWFMAKKLPEIPPDKFDESSN
ncbi:hypothetical protein QUB80_23500 [Chlorogloeopsis sp. ULAP01]|uniref:DUF5676 family membrane protein n=1 Tax=Chlorogloeopsis sp. ULAP01 TaxID=3056483 RepID=UPI0025AB28D7|nr:hypothetical protein [Chlorogloeopsis sp. ULAP01]MDM9383655.1 hypothetical protein [Chlorogloeopsis sp. ULAP01]